MLTVGCAKSEWSTLSLTIMDESRDPEKEDEEENPLSDPLSLSSLPTLSRIPVLSRLV